MKTATGPKRQNPDDKEPILAYSLQLGRFSLRKTRQTSIYVGKLGRLRGGTSMAKLLLVDDDPGVTTSLSEALTELGYLVDVAPDAAYATELLAVSHYDLLIVDWQMPGKTGIQFVQEVRNAGSRCAVMMLTGKSSTEDKMTGLDTGADDYLAKPFSLGELIARVRALLRRPRGLETSNLQCGDLVVNTLSRAVCRSGVALQLTRQEYLLLEFLMRNKNQVFNSEALVERAWSSMSESSPDTVRVHMANLRKKLKVDNADSPIKTVHGQGYLLKDEST